MHSSLNQKLGKERKSNNQINFLFVLLKQFRFDRDTHCFLEKKDRCSLETRRSPNLDALRTVKRPKLESLNLAIKDPLQEIIETFLESSCCQFFLVSFNVCF